MSLVSGLAFYPCWVGSKIKQSTGIGSIRMVSIVHLLLCVCEYILLKFETSPLHLLFFSSSGLGELKTGLFNTLL